MEKMKKVWIAILAVWMPMVLLTSSPVLAEEPVIDTANYRIYDVYISGAGTTFRTGGLVVPKVLGGESAVTDEYSVYDVVIDPTTVRTDKFFQGIVEWNTAPQAPELAWKSAPELQKLPIVYPGPFEEVLTYWYILVRSWFGEDEEDIRAYQDYLNEKLSSAYAPRQVEVYYGGEVLLLLGGEGKTFGELLSGPLMYPTCSDGTPYGLCSLNQPKYCDKYGILIDKCQDCGCPPENPKCCDDGTCIPEFPTIALPVITAIGIMFLMFRSREKCKL